MSNETDFSETFSSVDLNTIETQIRSTARKEKLSIMANISFLGFGFMLHFTALRGLYRLQSILHYKNKLGKLCLCLHGIAVASSNLLLSTAFIRRFGCKSTIAGCFFAFLPLCFAQYDSTPYTIIPAAIFCGLGTGPLLVSLSIYLIVISRAASRLLARNKDDVTWFVFGVFFMIFECSGIIVNAASLIGIVEETKNRSLLENLTLNCGSDFCPTPELEELISLRRPKKKHVNMLIAIYISFIVAASLTVWFLVDSIVRFQYSEPETVDLRNMTRGQLLTTTTKLMFKRKQLDIIPLTIFHGCERAFIVLDFTEAFVTCAWSIHYIGYVLITFHVLKATSAVLTGWLVRFKGKIPIFACAAGLHMILLVTLLLLKISKYIPLFFFISGLWGICSGAWVVSLNALYGIQFPYNLEAAYSNYRMWEAIGFVIVYAYSSLLCIKVKVGILIAILVFGMAGFVDTEIRLGKAKKKRSPAPIMPDSK